MYINNKTAFLILLVLANFTKVFSQCAMCRASLESNGNTQQGEAVNDGIVYLMAVPYVLVGIMAFVIYKLFSKKKHNTIHQ